MTNAAAVIDADGSYLGKYRKTHIPQVAGLGRDFSSNPGRQAFPFSIPLLKLGVYICYDRHFPEGWRALALNGPEYIVNPSATVAGLSEYLWKLEQPAAAVANGVHIGAINRVGSEAPWNIGEFYGQSYFVNLAARSRRLQVEIRMNSSFTIWILERYGKLGIRGSSSEIADRKHIRR